MIYSKKANKYIVKILISNKKRISISVILSILSSFFEIIYLIFVLKFISLLSSNAIEYNFLSNLEIKDNNYFLCVFLLISIVNYILKIINIKYTTSYAQDIRTLITTDCIQKYADMISIDCKKFDKNKIIKSLISDIDLIISTIFYPLLQLLTNFFTFVLILFGLIYQNFVITITLLIFMLIFYFVSILNNYKKVDIVSNKRDYINSLRHEKIVTLVDSLQEIIIYGFVKTIKNKTSDILKEYNSLMSILLVRNSISKNIIELTVIIILILIVSILLNNSSEGLNLVNYILLYMISFQRLLPFVQSLYNFFIQYKIGLPPLLSLLKETNQLKLSEKAIQFVVGEIILEDLTFKIPNSNKKLVIKRLVIKKSKPLIIVGESGCGKSCFLDVLLGFTLIESGKIYIDGKLVTNDFFIRNRANVSYVKQESTVLLSNPLLSMMLENCNKYVLEKISRKLNIYNLFTNDKQSKYGSTLRKYSGGERQRLSILRALLHDKQFLIGDEITSALDTENKEVLFNIVNESSHNKFCVFVSHEDMNLKNSSTFNFSSPSVLYI